ncbi:MAG: type II secretion system F family protein [Alphaproteobacteria bacterium]|nr:type II secretion system F family protein [Alphaproteobacteria bacterium]
MESFFQNPDFVSVLCGVAAFAVVVLIWTALLDNDPLPARLKAIAERRAELQDAQHRRTTRRAALQRTHLMKKIVNWFKLTQGRSLSELRLKLIRAGYRSRDAMFVFMFIKLSMLGGGIAVSLVLLFVLHVAKMPAAMGMAAVIFTGFLGWMLPDVIVKNMSQKRGAVLRKGLPDALDLLVICAEAGLSLDASFDRVGREMGQSFPDLAEEMGLTAVELSFLPERHKALHGLAERVPLPGMVALVNTLVQTEKYGTPLAQALRVLSAEMREDRIMKAEEKAARLPAILTVPMIIFILPPLFVVLIGPAAIKVMGLMAGMKQ